MKKITRNLLNFSLSNDYTVREFFIIFKIVIIIKLMDYLRMLTAHLISQPRN